MNLDEQRVPKRSSKWKHLFTTFVPRKNKPGTAVVFQAQSGFDTGQHLDDLSFPRPRQTGGLKFFIDGSL
ncbi:MAG: hypothetical protein DMG57_11660 [Acidobacteria bacterium]|nr:MAG: hypothetical protein DMG57_11660 [Acidobacteriota bacterium]